MPKRATFNLFFCEGITVLWAKRELRELVMPKRVTFYIVNRDENGLSWAKSEL